MRPLLSARTGSRVGATAPGVNAATRSAPAMSLLLVHLDSRDQASAAIVRDLPQPLARLRRPSSLASGMRLHANPEGRPASRD